MKTTPPRMITGLIIAATLSAATIMGQTQKIEATTTTITSEGTLTEFGPQGVVIKTETGAQPVRYISNETTNYVDEAGNPVDLTTLKSGVPAQVYYTKVGDTLIATKVLVRTPRIPARGPVGVVSSTTTVVPARPASSQAEAAVPAPERTEIVALPRRDRLETSTGTTMTSWGTVSGFGPDCVILQSETSPEPVPYFVSKKTTYVDESGKPIMADSIARGAAVTIYSTREGERLVASRIIVKAAVVLPQTTIVVPVSDAVPGAIIEKKTTTTTTTRKQ